MLFLLGLYPVTVSSIGRSSSPLPLYVHDYINPHTDTELLLVTGPLVVIALTLAIKTD